MPPPRYDDAAKSNFWMRHYGHLGFNTGPAAGASLLLVSVPVGAGRLNRLRCIL